MKLYFSLVLNLWPRVLLEFPLGCFLKHLAANRWKMSPFLSPFLPLSVLFTASWPGRLLLGLLISQTPEQSLAWLVRGGYCLTPLHPDRALKRQSSNLPAKAASLPAACCLLPPPDGAAGPFRAREGCGGQAQHLQTQCPLWPVGGFSGVTDCPGNSTWVLLVLLN